MKKLARTPLALCASFIACLCGIPAQIPTVRAPSIGQSSAEKAQNQPFKAISPLKDLANRVAEGQKLAPFQVLDHNGNIRSLENLKGPNGLFVVVVKSVDW